jgi:hypothetical protein
VYDESNDLIASYDVHRAWVSQLQAQRELDGQANALAIQHVRIETEGWMRSPTRP